MPTAEALKNRFWVSACSPSPIGGRLAAAHTRRRTRLPVGPFPSWGPWVLQHMGPAD